jgi:16S rRNA (cytosine967-C5)-methyltransferase
VAAARALIAIEEGAFAEDVLPDLLPDGRDHDLGWFLTLGVQQNRGIVDAALRPHLRQPLGGLDAEVRAVLRLGTFEKLFARTKAHAAVHQNVEVAKAVGARRAKGLVNAVLRRVQLPESPQRVERLNHPAWLIARWDTRYGAAQTDAWCAKNGEHAPLVVVLKDPGLVSVWKEQGLVLQPGLAGDRSPANCWLVSGHQGLINNLPGYDEGGFWVQDATAVAVADLCGAKAEHTVLDACAAPGGKTMRLLMSGARVTAVDRSQGRLKRVSENLARVQLTCESLHAHDWREGPLKALGTHDIVLVDAPCTALGTLRRSPEIRWRRHERDLVELAQRQREILAAAAAHVSPGGALVYAVCSPEPEEGQQVVDQFVEQHPDFAVEVALSTSPPQHDEDAHQAFRLRRQ